MLQADELSAPQGWEVMPSQPHIRGRLVYSERVSSCLPREIPKNPFSSSCDGWSKPETMPS